MSTKKTPGKPPRIPKRFGLTRKVEWWGQTYTVTPAVATSHCGDGRLLLGFQPANTRPNYYLIRVDSAFAGHDDIDEVIDALIDDFHEQEQEREHLEEDLREQGIEPTGDNTDLDGNEDRLGFPVLSLDSGYGWWTEAKWDGRKWVRP